MLNACKRFVASCEKCLQFRHAPPKSEPLSIETSGLFERFSFDFVGPMPETKRGNRYLIVAIEHLTSWPIAKAVPTIDSITLCRFILTEIVAFFGCPFYLLSDNGPQMAAAIYQDVLKLLGIKRQTTSVYHPSGNGKCERFNGTLMNEIRKMCADESRWDEVLDMALFSYRVRPRSKGMSPFRLLYGVNPRLPVDRLDETRQGSKLYGSLLLRRLSLETTMLERLQQPEVSFTANKPRFQVGDRVYCLRTQVLSRRVHGGGVPKFWPVFQGPFRVTGRPYPKLYRLIDDSKKQFSRNLIHEDRLIPAPARASAL